MSKWTLSLATTSISSPFTQKPYRGRLSNSHAKYSGYAANRPYATQRCAKPGVGTLNSNTTKNNTIIGGNLHSFMQPAAPKEVRQKAPSSFKGQLPKGPIKGSLVVGSGAATTTAASKGAKSRDHEKLCITAGNLIETNASFGNKKDLDDLEEMKEDASLFVRSTKAHVMCVRPPWEKSNSASNVNTDSSDKVKMSTEVIGGGKGKTLDKICVDLMPKSKYRKCKCPKNPMLPCCNKGMGWIKVLFEKKGIRFDHKKYKRQYEVRLVMLLIFNRAFSAQIHKSQQDAITICR